MILGDGKHNNESFTIAMVCSNCDHLKIYLAGRLVAEADPDRENFGNLPHPPFVKNIREGLRGGWGELRIDGYIGGKKVISKTMSGQGVDRQFHVEPDDVELIGDGIDATRAVFRVTDEFGAVRPFASGAISLSIAGPREIIGENPFALFGGAGAIWVRSRESSGVIRLTARHPTLGAKTIRIQVAQRSASL